MTSLSRWPANATSIDVLQDDFVTAPHPVIGLDHPLRLVIAIAVRGGEESADELDAAHRLRQEALTL
jgi:hypothetical protein